MKRAILAGILAIVLLAAGCGGVGGTKTDPAPAATVAVDGLSLSARASRAAYGPGTAVEVSVRVRNTGKQAVSYVKSDGCHDGVRVEAAAAGAGVGRFQHKDAKDRACTEAIAIALLEPGQEITAVYTWDRTADGVAVPPGRYRVTVSFQRGTDSEALSPVNLTLEITLS